MDRVTVDVNHSGNHRIRIQLLLVIGLTVFTCSMANAQQRLTSNVAKDPAAAMFVFRDVEHFIDAMTAIKSEQDSASALQSKYFDRASPGLKMFIQKYDLTVERLLKAMAKYPEDYDRLEETISLVKAQRPSFVEAYRSIKEILGNAVFPPTYFLVGGHRGIGSGSIEGPLITIEKETADGIREDLNATLVHEMMHMEQLAAVDEAYFAIFSGDERTLLATTIREGAATFFAELITGGSEHKNRARDYLLDHEQELWESFQEEMLGNEMGDWLWKNPANPDQPQDVGYALGARIVQTYYESAEDKQAAAQTVMAITDYPGFLEISGYANRMADLSDSE